MQSICPHCVNFSYKLPLFLLCLYTLVIMVTAYERPNTTIQQWDACRLSFKHHQKANPVECSLSEVYKKTKSQFKNLIEDDSECMNFTDLEKHEEINTDNSFINCYLSLEAKAVARSNSCFYQHYYSPIYIFCSKLETINDITFDIWNQCAEQIINMEIFDSGSEDAENDYQRYFSCDKETKNSIYKKIFDVVQSKQITACQSFYKYAGIDQLGSELNFEDYYKECFLSDSMLNVARQNACFYKNYFVPIFIDCARLKL